MEVGEVSLPQEEEVVGVFPLVEIVLPSGMVELGHFLIELANTWTGVAFELEAGVKVFCNYCFVVGQAFD